MDKHDIDLLDLVDHPVFALEMDGNLEPRYVAFNAFALEIIGLSLDDVVGKTASELYPGHLGDTAFRHHKKVFLTGTPQSYEILLPFGAKQELVRTSLRPVKNSAGRVIRLIGSSAKIAGQTASGQTLSDSDQMRAEMEEFINLAAHDLRTPIRNIRVISDMMKDDFKDMGDGKIELIQMLDDVGDKAMTLIGDVLRHADAASAAEQLVTFAFGDLVREVMVLLDPTHACEFTVTECNVRTDRRAVQIILRNLVDNAVKHFPKGKKQAKLDFLVNMPSRGTVEISLCDNGNGFANPARLFRDSRATRDEGGFGLLGVRRLLHARNGTIFAENLPDGGGAQIGFTLPGQIKSDHAFLAAGS